MLIGSNPTATCVWFKFQAYVIIIGDQFLATPGKSGCSKKLMPNPKLFYRWRANCVRTDARLNLFSVTQNYFWHVGYVYFTKSTLLSLALGFTPSGPRHWYRFLQESLPRWHYEWIHYAGNIDLYRLWHRPISSRDAANEPVRDWNKFLTQQCCELVFGLKEWTSGKLHSQDPLLTY